MFTFLDFITKSGLIWKSLFRPTYELMYSMLMYWLFLLTKEEM